MPMVSPSSNTLLLRPTIPPEITDTIIRLLCRDRQVLRLCSLVSRAWLPASRNILYETLAIRGEDVPSFISIAAPSENTYLGFVRAIDISMAENGPTESLLELLPQFTRLKTLRVVSSIFHFELPPLPAMTTLELSGSHFQSFAAFTALLSRVPNLHDLKMQNLHWGSPSGWAPPKLQLASSPQLKFKLSGFFVEMTESVLLDWLCDTSTAPSATSLTLSLPRWPPGVHRTSEYLKLLNVDLQTLYLRFNELDDIAKVAFSSNTSIRSLRVDFYEMNQPLWRRDVMPASELFLCIRLPTLLESFRSVLDELIIDIYTVPKLTKPGALDRLAVALSSAPLSRLRKLQFNGRWDSGRDAISAKLFTSSIIDKLPILPSYSVILFNTKTQTVQSI
ncbi:hypothetical protein R3P38DRAFT_1794848 [Favolaschia claudopus]|uniref:F-box domain-containing protein n=1 Tax=Favolaschia claudopus TaxID=2862362 RepID=A0AAW0A5S1_9AGAR